MRTKKNPRCTLGRRGVRSWLQGAVAGLALCLLAAGPVVAAVEEGFTPLFNGKDVTGWVVMGDPAGWRVVDGTLHSDGGKGGEWIRTDRQFTNFIFRLEWMLSTVGNSGVLIRTGEKDAYRGFEVQLLAPWTPTRDDLHCTGSIYGHVAVNPRPDETPNRWRQMEIACRYRHVTIRVDGQVCVDADTAKVPSLQNAPLQGYIGLQDSHTGPGEWVKFRNLRVKDLDQDPSFVTEGLQHADPAVRRLAEGAAARLGAPMVEPLCALLARGDVASRRIARGGLFAVAAAASAPRAASGEPVWRALLKQARSGAAGEVRSCAAEMLGLVGGGTDVVQGLTAALHDEAAHEAALGALQRIPGQEATRALEGALRQLPAARRPAIVHALGARRDSSALRTLRALARRGPVEVRTAALDALGQIGDPAASRTVEQACADRAPEVRAAATTALLALADGLRERQPASAARLYRKALASAVRGGQRSAALVGLSQTGAQSLPQVLLSALRERDTAATALGILRSLEGAAIEGAVAARLKEARGDERALLLRLADERDASGLLPLLTELADSDDAPVRTAALEILARRGQPEHAPLLGFVTRWWLLGPFPNPGQAAYDQTYAPEQGVDPTAEVEVAGVRLRWRAHRESKSAQGIVELADALGAGSDVACYAYAEITSDREQDVLLKLGSDDGAVLWLNGQRLFGARDGRALVVDQDVVKARLTAGTNRILLKVLQVDGRWAFCLRVTDPEGRPLRRVVQ